MDSLELCLCCFIVQLESRLVANEDCVCQRRKVVNIECRW